MAQLANAHVIRLLEASPDAALRALASSIGIGEQDAQTFFAENEIELNWKRILELLAQDACQYLAHIRTNGARRFRLAPKSSVNLFDADCIVFPVNFSMKRARSKIPEGAFNYGLFLTSQEKDGFLGGMTFDQDHVYNAFGYIRFYVWGDKILVIEIQGDMYGALKSNRLRRRYNDWYKLLLLGFEAYVVQCFGGGVTILIAGREYQLRRNPEFRLSLAQRLYDELPRMFHYTESDIDVAFEPVHSPLSVLSGWKKELLTGPSEGARRFVANHYRCRLINRFTEAFNTLISR